MKIDFIKELTDDELRACIQVSIARADKMVKDTQSEFTQSEWNEIGIRLSYMRDEANRREIFGKKKPCSL